MTKKTPIEWEKETGIKILDPDGWRFHAGEYPPQDFSVPVDRKEWEARMVRSTVIGLSVSKEIADWPRQNLEEIDNPQ